MADMTMIWNAILTMAIGGFMWWIRSTSASISKVKEEVSETREKMALIYATKEDVKDDMTQLMQRFDRLESKIDDMIRRQANNNKGYNNGMIIRKTKKTRWNQRQKHLLKVCKKKKNEGTFMFKEKVF